MKIDLLPLSEYLRRVLGRGDASQYVEPFDSLEPGDRVVLWIRVSSRNKGHDVHLRNQEAYLRQKVEERGAVVVDVVSHVGPGWTVCEPPSYDSDNPTHLRRAARLCRREGAKLVALCVNRFVRPTHYKSTSKSIHTQATDDDLQELARCTFDVTLVTYVDPHATDSEERSALTRTRTKKGGRPRRPHRPTEYQQRATSEQCREILR